MATNALIVAVTIVAAAIPAGAEQDPNNQRGFSPEKVFHVGDVDAINLFNGNMILTIPIGGAYPAGGSLSYSLTLVYNGKAWDYEEHPPYTSAQPCRSCNAGLGFTLSLGRLIPPNDPDYGNWNHWLYVAPDASEHIFWDTLHPNETVISAYRYTRDSSYIRMHQVSSVTSELQFPDGVTHTFELVDSKWRLASMQDPFGNTVTITYVVNSPPGFTTWEIEDSATNRINRVLFGSNGYVGSVTLESFNGGTASYSFDYDHVEVPRSCRDDDPNTSPTVWVDYLASITLPDGSEWHGFDYTSVEECGAAAGGQRDFVGSLKSLTLPTGGHLEWSYSDYSFFTCTPHPKDDPPVPTFSLTASDGVVSRSKYAADGITLEGEWTYDPHEHYVTGSFGCYDPSDRISEMVSPTGDATLAYFRLDPDEWDYALPYTTADPDTGGRRLSQAFYSGDPSILCPFDGGDCVITLDGAILERTAYARYEHDQFSDSAGNDDQQTNRREASTRTVYNTDGSKDVVTDRFDFDGLGHYRQTVTAGSSISAFGAWTRTITDYNPARHTYNIDQVTNDPVTSSVDEYSNFPGYESPAHSYVALSIYAPWVLGTYDFARQDQYDTALSSATQEYCFESGTGFLSRKRTLKLPDNDTPPLTRQRSSADLLAAYDHDTQGNVIREKYYGGDNQSINTGTLCSLSLPYSAAYRTDHSYQYGAMQRSWYVDGVTSLPFYSEDYDIDQSTGLIKASRDTAGIQTAYAYDAMGRLTWEKPSSGNGAWVHHQYLPYGTCNGPARVETCAWLNGTTADCVNVASSCSSVGDPLTRSTVDYDGFGRVAGEYTKYRDSGGTSAWNQRLTTHNALGWKTSVSEWQPYGTSGSALKKTVYCSASYPCDPFGRPTRITLPDSKTIDFTYYGVREIDRTVTIATSTSAETSATTKEYHDRNGRLWKVTEPSGAGGSNVTTTYAYDAGSRLKTAATTSGSTQTRTFTYDNRGFLLSETLPELGPGTVTYSKYDARGHAGRVQDGLHDVAFDFDAAERLTLAAQPDASGNPDPNHPLKELTYATANGSGDWAKGKLREVVMTNLPPTGSTGTTTVTETYTYGGLGGAVSAKQTDIALTGATAGSFSQSFLQSFTWNDLGKLASQEYPTCLGTGCPADAPERFVYNTYTMGLLTAVGPYYATSITYHPNLMVNTVTHAKRGVTVANGFTETAAVDPNAMARPASISTSGVTLPGTGAAANWSTGTYHFDGAGNVKTMGSDSFVYDKVSRLTQARIRYVTESYAFDAFGNMLTYAGRSLSPSAATNRMAAFGALYDAAGNLTRWIIDTTTYTAAYDRFNKQAKLSGGVFNQLNAYTTDGERVLWRSPSTGAATVELRDLSGHVVREVAYDGSGTWSWVKDHIYRGGLLLASQGISTPAHPHDGGLRHYALDHLGSPHMLTNRGGEKLALLTTNAWGMDTTGGSQDTTERMRYTVHERDLGDPTRTNDDVDYMHARNYPPFFARFASLDPERGDPEHPQSWNRYAYARNNPVVRVDPDGRADLRTPEQKWILEDQSVLAAVGEIVERTGFNQRRHDRVEAATVVVANTDSSLSTTGVVTGVLTGVNPPDVNNAVVTDTGQAAVATIHSHPGTGYIGHGRVMHGGKASEADKCFADVAGILSFIVNGSPDARDRTTRRTSSLIVYDPAKGSETAVLTENDYKEYLSRAVGQYQSRTADGN